MGAHILFGLAAFPVFFIISKWVNRELCSTKTNPILNLLPGWLQTVVLLCPWWMGLLWIGIGIRWATNLGISPEETSRLHNTQAYEYVLLYAPHYEQLQCYYLATWTIGVITLAAWGSIISHKRAQNVPPQQREAA
jgi:hypothetical protein